jgi:hypothetical protein
VDALRRFLAGSIRTTGKSISPAVAFRANSNNIEESRAAGSVSP